MNSPYGGGSFVGVPIPHPERVQYELVTYAELRHREEVGRTWQWISGDKIEGWL